MAHRAKPLGEGRRIALLSRTTPELRAKLEQAAADSGRSLGQEVEYRLERSLADDVVERPTREVGNLLSMSIHLNQINMMGPKWGKSQPEVTRYLCERAKNTLSILMSVAPLESISNARERENAEKVEKMARSDEAEFYARRETWAKMRPREWIADDVRQQEEVKKLAIERASQLKVDRSAT